MLSQQAVQAIRWLDQYYEPGKITSQVLALTDDWIFSCCVLWIMDGVTYAIFFPLITIVAEIAIKKNFIQVW